MTKKQWIILIVLLVMTLVPTLFGGHKKSATPESKQTGTQRELESSSQSIETNSDNLQKEQTNAELVGKADQALNKLASLSTLPVAEDSNSIDEILKDNELQAAPTPASERPPTKPTAIPKLASSSSASSVEVVSSAPPKNDGAAEASRLELERLRIQVVSLEAKLEDQKHATEAQRNDLKSKLDIQESENVKLSHQLQESENKSIEAQKAGKHTKEVETQVDKLKADLAEKQKGSDLIKSSNTDLSKKLIEEQKIRKSVEEQLEVDIKKRDEQGRENEKLRRVVGEFENRVKLLEEQRLADSKDKEQVLMKQLATLRKDLATAQGSVDDLKKKQKTQSTELTNATTKVETLQKQIETKQSETDNLSVRLATAERINEKSKDLQQQLLSARNELMLAQEQVRTLMSTSKNANPDYANHNYGHTEIVPPPRNTHPTTPVRSPANQQNGDYLTVEVTAQKAALRAGPGEENSTVMEIQQGSKLVVETREGDWYRVITPKGQRAYLRADLAVELDGSGQPRFSTPQTKMVAPNPRPTRTVATRPIPEGDRDPLVELLGRQLRDRQKNPGKEDSLDPDAGADGHKNEAGLGTAPTSGANGEDEMEAFDALKEGMKKDKDKEKEK